MRKGFRAALAAAALGSVLVPGRTLAQNFGASRETKTLDRAMVALDDVAGKPKGLPASVLRDAYAVAIFPEIIKGGFVVGGRFGHGVVLVRSSQGWGLPIFASFGGGSFGLQAGVQSTEMILVFKSKKIVDTFLRGEGKLTFGANGSLALGGMGRLAEAGTGVALKSQYVAYSKNRGLFAGASLQGAGLSLDHRANAAFYGRPIAVSELVAGASPDAPPQAAALRRMVMAKTGTPADARPTTVVKGRSADPDDDADDAPPPRTARRNVEADDDPPARPVKRSSKPKTATLEPESDRPVGGGLFPFP